MTTHHPLTRAGALFPVIALCALAGTLHASPTYFFWTNALNGAWSAAGNWTNENAYGTAPDSTGQAFYNLTFACGTNYLATNDLNAGFLLNQFTFGGSLGRTVALDGASLVLTNTATQLPRILQNSAANVMISNGMVLATNVMIGGTGTGTVNLPGLLSGPGGVTINTPGMVRINCTSPNTYSGGTRVIAGTLVEGHKNALGTGLVTLDNGAVFQQEVYDGSATASLPNPFYLSGGTATFYCAFAIKAPYLTNVVSGPGMLAPTGPANDNRALYLAASNTFSGGVLLSGTGGGLYIYNRNALGTGTVYAKKPLNTPPNNGYFLRSGANLSASPGVPNTFVIATNCWLPIDTPATTPMLISGPITGGGSIIKSGAGKLTLSGANSYTGSTVVFAGTLEVTSPESLGSGMLSITNGTQVNLNYSGTRIIEALKLTNAYQPYGTYGSPSSPAANKSTNFSGVGVVWVTKQQVYVQVTNISGTVVVPGSVTNQYIAGTNSEYTVGIDWTNSTGGGGSVTPGAWNFTAGVVPGANVITVKGTNAFGEIGLDSVTIIRAVTPYVDITNADFTVGMNDSAATIGGTNNIGPAGMMWLTSVAGGVTNYAVSLPAATPWTAVVSNLVGGTTNYVTMAVTNGVGESASDTVRIYRGVVAVVDITNVTDTVTTTNATQYIAGTNNDLVVGGLTWTNSTGGGGTLNPVPGNWSFTASIVPGNNVITVSGTNSAGDVASDSVTVSCNANQYSWTNSAGGIWSVAGNWIGGVPTSSGMNILNFNVAGAYGSVNDLAGTFQLNQLNLDGPTLTLSGNPLQFDGIAPTVNQNGAAVVTLSNNVALVGNTSMSGGGTGTVAFVGVLSGTGSLTKTTSGTLRLSGANTFSGGIIISNGTLNPAENAAAMGTGPVTLHGGTAFAYTHSTGQGKTLANAFYLPSGTVTVPIVNGTPTLTGVISGSGGLDLSGNSFHGVVLNGVNTFTGGMSLSGGMLLFINNVNAVGTGPLNNTGDNRLYTQANLELFQLTNTINLSSGTLTVRTASGGLHISSVITGTGALTKQDANTLTLSGANTYSGATLISAGSLVGVTGGFCSNSALTAAAASFGVRVTDTTKPWSCKSLTTSGTGPNLNFDFGRSVTPSTSLAPLLVNGAMTFSTTPTISVAGLNLAVGSTYPLMTWGSNSGTAPTVLTTLPPPSPTVAGTLAISGTTLMVTITTNTTWAGPSVCIMPLGDSITAGFVTAGGYREPLYSLLTSAGYLVNFVGTVSNYPGATLPYPAHEGHGGFTISGIDGGIVNWLSQVEYPDVILLCIGANDANTATSNAQLAGATNRLENLIVKIATNRPMAKIIVSNLIPNARTNSGFVVEDAILAAFNPYVPEIVARQAALGRNVSFTDMHSSLTFADLTDGLHPNATGYRKMATNWFNAITALYPPGESTNLPSDVQQFLVGRGADYGQVALSWSNGLITVLACTNRTYSTNEADWFVLASGVATPWTHTAASNFPSVYYRIVSGTYTSQYAVGKYDVNIAAGSIAWLTFPFAVQTGCDVLGTWFGQQLAARPDTGYNYPSLQKQNGPGGTIQNSDYYVSGSLTNWFGPSNIVANAGYVLFLPQDHPAVKVTGIGMVQTNNVTIQIPYDSIPWIGLAYDVVMDMRQSGLTNMLQPPRLYSTFNYDFVDSQQTPGGPIWYAEYYRDNWGGNTVNFFPSETGADKIEPGKGYLIFFSTARSGTGVWNCVRPY